MSLQPEMAVNPSLGISSFLPITGAIVLCQGCAVYGRVACWSDKHVEALSALRPMQLGLCTAKSPDIIQVNRKPSSMIIIPSLSKTTTALQDTTPHAWSLHRESSSLYPVGFECSKTRSRLFGPSGTSRLSLHPSLQTNFTVLGLLQAVPGNAHRAPWTNCLGLTSIAWD